MLLSPATLVPRPDTETVVELALEMLRAVPPPDHRLRIADIGTGSIGLIVDSYGLIALVADRSSAAAELGIAAGDGVTLRPLTDDEPTTGVEVKIELGRAAGRTIGRATGPDTGSHT